MSQDLHRAWLRMGLVYLGIGGGLLAYLAQMIADWSSAPPFTYTPFEEVLQFPTVFIGGVASFVLLGLGLYYIIKSASHSQS